MSEKKEKYFIGKFGKVNLTPNKASDIGKELVSNKVAERVYKNTKNPNIRV